MPEIETDQEYEVVEQKSITVTASQFYHDFKDALKKLFIGILGAVALFVLWKLFSFWFFAGLVVSSIPLAWFVIHVTKVPRTLVMSMHVADGEDDADYFALYAIPDHMLERFKRTGSDFYYITTIEGTQVAVCDSLDFEEWTIKTPWFTEFSNLEFFRSKLSFLKLRKMLEEEIRTNSDLRAAFSARVEAGVSERLNVHWDNFDKIMSEPELNSGQGLDSVLEDRYDPKTEQQLSEVENVAV
ncbi:hypothetical protein LI82_05055 [Methanococcoides methylutens]|uniref:Uncharacterized protein n=1 Tax=Methanococcoides methylutens TaxID=2226 RepID=A0A099T394_METMT|nr:ATP synthase subunit I [Methanococcoides methylutens]KGK99374.1 hypothetical protein LI82_05055 [Methanococcoides methylutens]